MNGVDFVRNYCKEKGVSIRQLEKDLGFSNGYLNPKKLKTIPYQRAVAIAEYLQVDINSILDEPATPLENTQPYYVTDETAEITQKLFENKELRLLFSAAKDSPPEDLKMAHDMLVALKRKERQE